MGTISKSVIKEFLEASKSGGVIDDLLGAVGRPRAHVSSAVAKATKHVQVAVPEAAPQIGKLAKMGRSLEVTGYYTGTRGEALALGKDLSGQFSNGAFFDLGSTRKSESLVNRAVR